MSKNVKQISALADMRQLVCIVVYQNIYTMVIIVVITCMCRGGLHNNTCNLLTQLSHGCEYNLWSTFYESKCMLVKMFNTVLNFNISRINSLKKF